MAGADTKDTSAATLTALRDLRTERDRFVAFAFATTDLLVEVDSKGRIKFISGVVGRISGSTPAKLLGEQVLQLVAPQDRRFLVRVLDRALATGRIRPVPMRLTRVGGGALHALMGGMRYGDDIFLNFVIAPQQAREAEMERDRDAVTGMLDKSTFIKRATDRALRPEEDQDYILTMLSVAGLDTQDFTEPDGEVRAFMEDFGALLRSWSVGGDMAGTVSEGRFGVVTNQPIGSGELTSLIEQYRDRLSGKPGADLLKIDTFQVDMDVANISDEDAARALVFAINEFAATSDLTTFSIDKLSAGAQQYLSDAWGRVAQVRAVIDSRQFTVAFQPILNIHDRSLGHFEALTRIEGSGSPFELVTFAEKVGMILDLDIVIAQRLIDILEEEAKHQNRPMVAMNISARSLQSNLFIDAFRKTLREAPNVSRQISVEITETAHVAELAAFNKVIQALREDGHRVSLDDVGTGATSFETLRQVQVDYAKLDGFYIQNAHADGRDAAVIETVVNLCKALGCEVVAEMVEHEAQVTHLKQLGVTYGQGYLFGKPMEAPTGLQWPRPDHRPPLGRRQGEIDDWR